MRGFQAFTLEWATEALRVHKTGVHLLSFAAARTYQHMVVGIEIAGFEIRDQIMWVFGSGFPKSHNLKGDLSGWGTTLKPAHEPICMARNPFPDTVAANVAEHGTGAINIAACRIHSEDAQKRMAPGHSVNTTGSYKQDVKFVGVRKSGRWPANQIHYRSDVVVAMFSAEAGAAVPVKGTESSSPDKHTYREYPRVEDATA